ncbi:MAG: isoprenyl transferase [Fusobacterium perfoetens]|uniref:isoprenyl transferase n=1 Tax=Fusobacterium perfoetens TaxID=852 RepID=UPI0023F4E09E|nr:isoprenyl transferase [Fusobacterium perfoetens]MCI6152570.1 isoprenyl transferase [Fusobacterium perfoetens]MDY3237578.1 isoprenyl transferase [Fusobacterium perfoetens]
MEKNINIPKHIGIIMDGNGRWAKSKNRPRVFGHKAGAAALRKIVEHCRRIGVEYLTVYAFSTENWKRSQEEVNALMTLFKTYINSERKMLLDNNVRFMVSGRKEGVSESLLKAIEKLQEETSKDYKMTLNIAFNYGGRAEIIDAIKKIKDSQEEVTEENFSKYLYNDLPDPELIIRTSGEFRISNFLLWQIAYSEFYITDTYWPDFDEKELEKAIYSYNKRERRFGGRLDAE